MTGRRVSILRAGSLALACALVLGAGPVAPAGVPAAPQQEPGAGRALLSGPARGAAVEAARALLVEQRNARGVPGLSAAVAVDGRTVWSEGVGYADLEHRAPATAETVYRIGSVSKPVTATAVVQLALEGRLDLDAPVQRYVPSFPEKEHPVTTRLLAGHLAGIRHYRGDESVDEGQRHYDDVVDALAIFADDPLLYEPGERYSYSSYAWNLISAVVQGASGRPFLETMQTGVFDPLAMQHTYADDPRAIVPRRTRFYASSPRGPVNAPFVDNSYKWAGGGFIACVEDLVRFGQAHLSPGFLPEAGLELLFTSQRTRDGRPTGYGIGWRVGTLGDLLDDGDVDVEPGIAGLRVMHHGGSSVGGRAFLLLVPEAGMAVAAAANYDRFDREATAAGLARAFLAAR